MALPTGVTRIPRRSVTKTVNPSFPLAGRLGNTAAGDLLNPGNIWLTGNGPGRLKARRTEALLNEGSLMAVVLGNDVRSWIRVTTDHFMVTYNRLSLKPGAVYYATGAVATSLSPAEYPLSGFKFGDRVTFINLGTADFDINADAFYSGGAVIKIRLKANNPGRSVTLEWLPTDTTNPSSAYGLFVVAATGTIGTLGDGNPIGVGT